MEPELLNTAIEIKQCVVQLERIKVIPDDFSDSDDLPNLCEILPDRKKKKCKRSAADLLKEHQSLVQNIIVDSESLTTMEETIRRLETVEVNHTDDRSSTSSFDSPSEDNFDVKIFCVKDYLVFFNSSDITPSLCGYDFTPEKIYEKDLLSFKHVEFEHVISSFLQSAKDCCISDLQSFVTFLLKTLSVHRDLLYIVSCYEVLVSMLKNHRDSSCLTFSSAEIFMLLFNFGVDTDSFKFLSNWSDIKKKLQFREYIGRTPSPIPSAWLLNLKYSLKSLIKLVSTCCFEAEEMDQIIMFLMFMSKDFSIITLLTIVSDCIYVCLENIKQENWNKSKCNIVNNLLFSESSSKWIDIYDMTDSIPNNGERCIELRKQISFSSLKCLCLGSNEKLDENSLGFHLNELQYFIQNLVEINCHYLKYAAKFVDNCVKSLNASKEEYIELCDLIKRTEASFSQTAQNEKTLFIKIYAKLSVFCGQKMLLDGNNIFNLANVKSEFNNDQRSSEYDYYKHSSCSSEIDDKSKISFTPDLSDSQSNSNQSNYSSSLSSKDNYNNVRIKSEDIEEPCETEVPTKVSPLKLLIRKKRSSRSLSGNKFQDVTLTNNDLECKSEDTSRQSSEFECRFLSDNPDTIPTVVSNMDVDLDIPGPSLVISDFSIEEETEETCSSVKMEIDPFYDHTPVAENNDNTISVNESSTIPVNNATQDLFMLNQTPVPEIFEVKSLALDNKYDIEHSSSLTSISKFNSSLIPESVIDETISSKNYVQPPIMVNESNLGYDIEKITPVLESSALQTIVHHSSATNQDISSSAQIPADNLLNIDEDIVIIQEKKSPNKLLKADGKGKSLPPSILKYSKRLSEISFTPIENKSSPSNTPDNEDIVIVEEKSPNKKYPGVKPVSSIIKPQINNNISTELSVAQPNKKYPGIKPIRLSVIKPLINDHVSTELNIAESNKKYPGIKPISLSPIKPNINANISTELNEKYPGIKPISSSTIKSQISDNISTADPQVEVSKFSFGSQENSSDSDEIVIVDEIIKNSEADTSKIPQNMDNHIVNSDDKQAIDISPLTDESSNPQQHEELSSVLKQNSVEKNNNSVCSKVLDSIIELVDIPVKEPIQNNDIVSNSCDVNSDNKNLVLDDKDFNLTEEFVPILENEIGSTNGLSINLNSVESELEIEQKNSNSIENPTSQIENCVKSPVTVNESVLECDVDKLPVSENIALQKISTVPNAGCIPNISNSNILHNIEIDNALTMTIPGNNNKNTASSQLENCMKSPVIVNESILECDVDKLPVSENAALQNISTVPNAGCIPNISNSNSLHNIGIDNTLTMTIPGNNIKNTASFQIENCVQSLVTVTESVLECDVDKLSVSENAALQKISTVPIAGCVPDISNSNILHNIEIDNTLTMTIPGNNNKNPASSQLENCVKSPVIVNESILECDVDKLPVSENAVLQKISIVPVAGCVPDISNSNILHNIEIDNTLTMTIPGNNNNTASSQIKNCVKSPVIVNESVLECGVDKLPVSENAALRKISTVPIADCVPDISNSNTLHNTEININLTMTIPGSNNKNCSMPLVNSSDESVFNNNQENNGVSGNCIQNFKKYDESKGKMKPVSNQNKVNSKITVDALFKTDCARKTILNRKRMGQAVCKVAKKSRISKLESCKVSEKNTLSERNTSNYISPSHKIRKKRSLSSMFENKKDNSPGKFHSRYSPMKSPLSSSYYHTSPKKPFNYNSFLQKYKHRKKSVLSKEGLNLSRVLRENISSLCNREITVSDDDDDSEITVLYNDPKRYADKECLVIYESEDVVILDSD